MKLLKGLGEEDLEEFFLSLGGKKFQGRQTFRWIYHVGVSSFEEMTDLPKVMRETLREKASLETLRLIKVQQSKTDKTAKYLFELPEEGTIETVFMKYSYGNSVCISSQAGCRMGCAFCASGIDGLQRNLTAGEMIDQLLLVSAHQGEPIGHLVVMGTGEPFDNYEELSKFLKLVNHKSGRSLGFRNITVSTCGLVPMIKRFARDFPQVNLAVSLHGPTDEIRSRLMPINRTYNINALIAECIAYTEQTGRRITFEYALIRGVNDSPAHATQLASILRGMLAHVNLIPLNGVMGKGLEGTQKEDVRRFFETLQQRGITATIRRELGADIDAACGQLRLGAKKGF